MQRRPFGRRLFLFANLPFYRWGPRRWSGNTLMISPQSKPAPAAPGSTQSNLQMIQKLTIVRLFGLNAAPPFGGPCSWTASAASRAPVEGALQFVPAALCLPGCY